MTRYDAPVPKRTAVPPRPPDLSKVFHVERFKRQTVTRPLVRLYRAPETALNEVPLTGRGVKPTEWRSLLKRYTPQARQILSKMLRDKLVFTPGISVGIGSLVRERSRRCSPDWCRSFHKRWRPQRELTRADISR
jgi:hypothetical protein